MPYHITYYWPSNATPLSPTARPIKVLPTYHLLTPILLPCMDTKEVPLPPPSSPPPPELRQVFRTFTLILTLGTVSSSVSLFHPINILTLDTTSEPSSLPFFFGNNPPPPLLYLRPTFKNSRIWPFSLTRSSPASATKELPSMIHPSVIHPEYSFINSSLASLL